MKKKSIVFLFFSLSTFLLSCDAHYPKMNQPIFNNCDSLLVEKIPRSINYLSNDTIRSVDYFFSVCTDTSQSEYYIEKQIEDYFFNNIFDSLRIFDFQKVTVSFLKSSKETNQLLEGFNDDSNLPNSSAHYRYVTYSWIDGHLHQKLTRNHQKIVFEIKHEDTTYFNPAVE